MSRTFAVVLGLLALTASGGQLRGRVLSAEKQTPISGASVELAGHPRVVADAAGRFALSGLRAGPVTLRLGATGYQQQTVEVVLPESGEQSLLLAMWRVPGPGAVFGTLSTRDPEDATRQLPAAGVKVEVRGRPSVVTDDAGRFRVDGVGPGLVKLQLTGQGLEPTEEVASVPSWGEAQVTLVLERLGEKAVAAFKGQVRSRNGLPLVATISIKQTGAKVTTGVDGNFELPIPGGRYTLTIQSAGHAPQTRSVKVDPGDQALFYVNLTPTR